MRLYIDPGTGSMLFAILIGIIGALNYLLKSWIVKLRFILSGGKKVEGDTEKLPFIIFSDDKRYWNVFEPVCRELNRRGLYAEPTAATPAAALPRLIEDGIVDPAGRTVMILTGTGAKASEAMAKVLAGEGA